MMEIDLPRMRSLSPHFDSSQSVDSMTGMTNLNFTDVTESTKAEPLRSPINESKNCDWKYVTDVCGCKSICGCKYINKVSQIKMNFMRINWHVFLVQFRQKIYNYL